MTKTPEEWVFHRGFEMGKRLARAGKCQWEYTPEYPAGDIWARDLHEMRGVETGYNSVKIEEGTP